MEALDGLLLVVSSNVILFIFLGVAAGLLFGALPGLDATTGVALLLPITYVLSPLAALAFFSSLYAAGVFSGSITAILFRTPGSSEGIMSVIEGHHFTARGEAGFALGVAVFSSVVGGLIASVAMFTITPFLASMALQFGPAEYFALGLLGLCCISAMTAKDHLKGVSAAILGLLLSTVGIDEITGAKRFDFGVPTLLGGVPFIPAVIGLFAASEVYRRVAVRDLTLVHGEGAKFQVRLPALADLLKLRWTILRSSFLGLGVGILPGAGATTAAILAYTAEVRLSKRPQDFGTGKIEGLAAPEAANNAAAVGAMIPLLSLGIPGSGTTAVLMGAFLIHNLTPGPFLFINHPELVYGLFSSIALANIVILILAVGFIHLFARLALLPYPMLATGILSISIIGSLAFGDLNAVMIMLIFALVGLALEAFDYPLAPVVLGLVLGPIVEFSLRRALLMSDFDFLVLVQRPITAVLLAVAIMFLTAPLWRLLWRHTFGSGASAADRQG